jgi:hypothetical protein
MSMEEKEIDNNVRYHVIPDVCGDRVLVFDAQTGALQSPECWQDLAAYYAYLVGRGRIKESQELLAESIGGNKPITRMLKSVVPSGLVVSRS